MSEMCCTRLAENTGRKNYAKNRHLRTTAQICRAISSQLRHVSTIGKKLVKWQYLLHTSSQYGPLTAEICWRVWGIPANFNGFRALASLLQQRRSPEVNQTLHDVCPSPGLVHCIYILGAVACNGILPAAKFTSHPCLTFSYIGSVTARLSSSGRQPMFAAWNYGTFAEGATYIRQGGHHVGHWPKF